MGSNAAIEFVNCDVGKQSDGGVLLNFEGNIPYFGSSQTNPDAKSVP